MAELLMIFFARQSVSLSVCQIFPEILLGIRSLVNLLILVLEHSLKAANVSFGSESLSFIHREEMQLCKNCSVDDCMYAMLRILLDGSAHI